MKARSDQLSCALTHAETRLSPGRRKASSVMTAKAASSPRPSLSCPRSAQTRARMPARRSNSSAMTASRPAGARISATPVLASRFSITSRTCIDEQWLRVADEFRHSGKHAMKLAERGAQPHTTAADPVFADGLLMCASAFLDHRHRAPDGSRRLEEAQQYYGIGEVGDLHRRVKVADQTVLRDGQERRHPLAIEELQQLVDVQGKRTLIGHGGPIPVQAVDNDGGQSPGNLRANAMREFTRRQFRCIHLFDVQQPGIAQALQ